MNEKTPEEVEFHLSDELSKIQRELKAPKGQFNKFGNYKYRSCEDILNAVKPLLPEGMSVVCSDKIHLVGNRFYIEATATLSYKDGGISVTAYAREADSKKGMDESQITGSASSYARKYALNGLFAIDDTKDADTRDNTTGQNEAQGEVNPGDYVFTFGKFKGKKLSDLDIGEVKNYLTYLHKMAQQNSKPKSKGVLEAEACFEMYCADLGK